MAALRRWGVLCGVACALAAGPAGAADPSPLGEGTLRLSVVGVGGEGLGGAPQLGEIVVDGFPAGDRIAQVRTDDLRTGAGDRCPGVGALCTGDAVLTVADSGTELLLDVANGPAGRLHVFSGDCDGTATLAGDTRARLRLASGETKDCRVTFVRPDDGAVSESDTILFVEKTYDHDPSGRPLPDQTLRLDAAGDSVASRPTRALGDLSIPGAPCPRFGRPTCRWSVALDYDGLPQPLVLSESADPGWLPVIGGDCDARGRLPVDDRGGEAVSCTVDNVLLEAQTGSARNAIVRIEVVALGATPAAQQASVAVRSFVGDQQSDVGTLGMVGPAGAPCAGLGAAVCTGDVGVHVDPDPRGAETERFVVAVESAPAGADVAFSGACVGATHSIDLGVGELATCRVTFVLHTPVPTAVLDAPSAVPCGTSVGFSGARSTAGAGASLHEYRWQFGDGSPLVAAHQSSISHTYASAGAYAARLVVVDDLGQESAPAQRAVLVGTTGVPTAVLSVPPLVLLGRTFTASGASSTDPESGCGDRIHSYRFTVDGGPPIQTADASVTLGPLAPGTHTVALVVRDTFGNESAPVTRTVPVPGLPTAVLDAPSTAACGATVTLSGARSTAGPGASVHRYRWDFGDGSLPLETHESSVTHAYASARGYQPRLVVLDTVGQESAAVQRTVGVGTTGAPTAVLAAPAVVLDGRTLTASGAGSTDPESGCGDRITEYRFSVDGGPTIATPSSSLTLGPLAPGTHTVTLVVRDSFGNLSSPASRSLRVDAAPVIVAKGDVVAESKLAPIVVVYTSPAARDAVDGTVPVTCVSASGAKFPSGTTRVVCTARDSVGNVSTSAFNVVVRLPTTTGAVTKPGNTTKVLASVTSGQRVRVNAGGFAPGSALSLVFVAADGTTIPIGTATAGEDGRFDVRVKLPKKLPSGEGQVTAFGVEPAGEEFVRAWLLDVQR